jgi:hypothetical protein
MILPFGWHGDPHVSSRAPHQKCGASIERANYGMARKCTGSKRATPGCAHVNAHRLLRNRQVLAHKPCCNRYMNGYKPLLNRRGDRVMTMGKDVDLEVGMRLEMRGRTYPFGPARPPPGTRSSPPQQT